MELYKLLETFNGFLWCPVMLVLLVGTGIYLNIALRFFSFRNWVRAYKCLWQGRSHQSEHGEISPWNALMTALAADIGTGNVVGVALAMLGVIACPITSGDTAFRSARLVLADWFHVEQKSIKGRLMLCIPVLGVGAILGVGNALGKIDYTIIWRYFSWTNQTLAMIVLWAASMYLFYDKKNYWITAVPATFMSAVSVTYFLLGNECLGQFLNHKTAEGATVYNTAVAYPIGIIAAALFLGIFLYTIKKRHTQPHYETLHK